MKASDDEALELSYRENKDREKLNAVEDARFLAEGVLRAWEAGAKASMKGKGVKEDVHPLTPR